MNKILVVGSAGGGRLAAAVAVALADTTCQVEVVDGFTLEARPDLGEPLMRSAYLPTDNGAHGWYQRFTGNKGRPPRY